MTSGHDLTSTQNSVSRKSILAIVKADQKADVVSLRMQGVVKVKPPRVESWMRSGNGGRQQCEEGVGGTTRLFYMCILHLGEGGGLGLNKL